MQKQLIEISDKLENANEMQNEYNDFKQSVILEEINSKLKEVFELVRNLVEKG